MKRQLTLKFVLGWLIGLSVLPLLLLAAYLAYASIETRQDEATRDASHRASNFATVVENRLGAQVAGLQMLAASPSLADPARLDEFYAEAQGYREHFRGHVILADASLQMIVNTRAPFGTALPRLPAPRGRGPSAALAALASGRPAISGVVDGPVANQPLIAIAVPVMREGRPIQLLLATIETRQFQAEVDRVAMSEGWMLALLDGQGETIARRSTVATSTAASTRPRAIVQRVAMTPWRVVLEIPPEVWRAPTLAAAMAVFALLIAATFASLVVGRQASRWLLGAVSSLAQASDTTAPLPLEVIEIEQVRARLDGAAASLRESEARYRALFDNHHTVMLLVDPGNGAIVDANPAAERFYGSTREQLATMSLFDINTLPPEQIRAEMQHAARVVRNDFHFRHRAARGQVRDVNVLACPVEVAGRKLLFAIIHDETERVRADTALRETASLLRMAGKLARFGGWSVDLAEGTVHWSDEVAAIHEMPPGYSPQVQEGISFYAPEWRGSINECFGACARDGTPYDEEMEIIAASGRRVWVRTIGQAIRDEAGRIIRVQGAFQDIDHRKQVEKALVKSERRYRSLFENMSAGFALYEV
ncbi:MAG: PAS domain S-box protein, partial [Steroidobacteraceae bacterium]|nr:PAS domain S-box protein [Steroidobacteraceae bacterium]